MLSDLQLASLHARAGPRKAIVSAAETAGTVGRFSAAVRQRIRPLPCAGCAGTHEKQRYSGININNCQGGRGACAAGGKGPGLAQPQAPCTPVPRVRSPVPCMARRDGRHGAFGARRQTARSITGRGAPWIRCPAMCRSSTERCVSSGKAYRLDSGMWCPVFSPKRAGEGSGRRRPARPRRRYGVRPCAAAPWRDACRRGKRAVWTAACGAPFFRQSAPGRGAVEGGPQGRAVGDAGSLAGIGSGAAGRKILSPGCGEAARPLASCPCFRVEGGP